MYFNSVEVSFPVDGHIGTGDRIYRRKINKIRRFEPTDCWSQLIKFRSQWHWVTSRELSASLGLCPVLETGIGEEKPFASGGARRVRFFKGKLKVDNVNGLLHLIELSTFP